MYAADGKWTFEFSVKFYPPEPNVMQEEITRSAVSVSVYYTSICSHFCRVVL